MDNGINETSTERSAVFLEACRTRIDLLAIEGQEALVAAMDEANAQLQTVSVEVQQAAKAIELSTGQQESLNEIRRTTEERLEAARADENDAYLAASTVRKMIEDASNLRPNAKPDTAKILATAGDVLMETCERAEQSYAEKQQIRKEVEAALSRLDATDKALLYSIAKAERNSSEKLLEKVKSERRLDVYRSEIEVLQLNERRDKLSQQREQEAAELNDVEYKLSAAYAAVSDCGEAEQQHQVEASRQLQSCEDENAAALSAAAERIVALEQDRAQARSLTDAAQNEYDRLVELGRQAEARANLVRDIKTRELTAARADQQRQLADINEELSALRALMEDRNQAYDNAFAAQQAALQALTEVKRQQEDCKKRVAEAQVEEESAQDAAVTAQRLLDNVTQIRDSVNNESSDMLLHAQDVLSEAAASARDLLTEKTRAHEAARHAQDQLARSRELANRKSEQATQLLALKETARNQANMNMAAAEDAAVLKRRTLEESVNSMLAVAQQEQQAANAEVAAANEEIGNARAALDSASESLRFIEEDLPKLMEEQKQLQNDGLTRLQTLREQLNRKADELRIRREAAEAEVERLKADSSQRLGKLDALDTELSEVRNLCDQARDKVDELVAAGLLDILSAEDAVDKCRLREEDARQIAGDVIDILTADREPLTYSPQPAEPEPIVEAEPEPVVVPEPVAVVEPEPIIVEKPEPVVVPTPEPVAVVEPEPIIVEEPEPVVVPAPAPVAIVEPEPVIMEKPEPVVVPEPAPVAVVEPEPIIAEKPEPVVVPEPAPVAVVEPEPIIMEKPEPVVVPAPVAVVEPEPVIAEIPEPVVVPAPVAIVEPEPIIVEEPEPVVAPTPEPVALSEEAPRELWESPIFKDTPAANPMVEPEYAAPNEAEPIIKEEAEAVEPEMDDRFILRKALEDTGIIVVDHPVASVEEGGDAPASTVEEADAMEKANQLIPDEPEAELAPEEDEAAILQKALQASGVLLVEEEAAPMKIEEPQPEPAEPDKAEEAEPSFANWLESLKNAPTEAEEEPDAEIKEEEAALIPDLPQPEPVAEEEDEEEELKVSVLQENELKQTSLLFDDSPFIRDAKLDSDAQRADEVTIAEAAIVVPQTEKKKNRLLSFFKG